MSTYLRNIFCKITKSMLLEIWLVLTCRMPIIFWKWWRCRKYVAWRVNLERFTGTIVVIWISFIVIWNGKLFPSALMFSNRLLCICHRPYLICFSWDDVYFCIQSPKKEKKKKMNSKNILLSLVLIHNLV